ncbi:MAG: HEPN domain-containing protein [Desulfobacterales bacterium]|nr:HEPN domain-containing protein [Pseudomonadota bacterium]MBU4357338.1 HEPN domain-containing protein [Pseudomonadota bacterium]MCG2773080.1 HEPN domain-containing protein [Desulfobacterales bacterium]
MRPPEEVKRDLVRQWLARADDDLDAAKFLFAPGKSFFAAICFHCQQAAEKYLKALLTWHQIEFPKTHDLELLLSLIASTDSALASSLTEVALLNPYGVEIRYPGDVPETTGKDAEEAMRLADKVQEAIFLALKDKA